MSADFQDILDEPDEVESETVDAATPETVAVDVSERTDAADTPSEQVSGGPPESEQPSASEVVLPEGYKRDAQGRVHRPDGTIASKDEVAGFPTATPQPPAVEAVVPVVEAPKVEAPPVAPEPFWVRASGEKTTIPHTTRNADGSLTIAPDGVALVRDLFTQGIAHRQSWPQEKQHLEQRIAQADARSDRYHRPAVAAADALLPGKNGEVPSLLASIVSEIADPEIRERVAERWYREAEYLRRDLAHMLRESDLAAPKAEAPTAANDTQIEYAARAALTEEVEDLFDTTPNMNALFTEQERKELADEFQSRLPAFFADQNGEIVLDRHALKRAFEREVSVQQRIKGTALKATQDAQKAKEAAAFNAANRVVPAPTATRPKTQPALTAAPGTKVKSWDKRVDDIWKEKDDDE